MIEISDKGIERVKKEALQKFQRDAKFLIAQSVQKDSNNFCPEDTGTLKSSTYGASDLHNGVVAWKTPYAKVVYYKTDTHLSTDKNPNASHHWFEVAKTSYLHQWVMIGAKKLKEVLER